MTANKIKELVAAKIARQGNQVDIGNVLPDILNAIVDSISTRLKIKTLESFSGTKAQVIAKLGVTEQEFDDLCHGKYTHLMTESTLLSIIYCWWDAESSRCDLVAGDLTLLTGAQLQMFVDGDTATIEYSET